jgi:hypothetical protein
MINWELEVEEEDACPADDMKATGCSGGGGGLREEQQRFGV